MEGESPLLKEGALSLQTSLSHRELPPRAPVCTWQRVVSLCTVRVLLGEVFCFGWEVIFLKVRLSHLFCGCAERYAGAPPSDCALWECVTYQTAPIKKSGVVGNDLCVVPLRGMLLVNGYTIPYTSAEIPPAGAPSGFDSAATVGFCVRHYTVVPLRSE